MSQIEVNRRLLSENDQAAQFLRDKFRRSGTLVVNLISSPGSGKTTLLEATVARMAGDYRLAAIEGDIATERDAERLRRQGIPARQIVTGGACHLDARQVKAELEKGDWGDPDILFIENVGNLVCPTSYDLGEDFKVVVLSVTEGDDKPFKYPGIFARAWISVISKIDLLPYVEFDVDAVRAQVRALSSEARLLLTSARTGEGVDEWCALLSERVKEKKRR
ncbi:MAG TPA: hydrogenase nickel incorporation protein HypB [Acidobacteriota bacterium]|nr:hydrogenase nickel incorporation protein HypB [Acidobacteriota bacterium]